METERTERSVVLGFGACDKCGTYGVARYYDDGSCRVIVPACCHGQADLVKPLAEVMAKIERAEATGLASNRRA